MAYTSLKIYGRDGDGFRILETFTGSQTPLLIVPMRGVTLDTSWPKNLAKALKVLGLKATRASGIPSVYVDPCSLDDLKVAASLFLEQERDTYQAPKLPRFSKTDHLDYGPWSGLK